jgi:hypothetical protein
VVSLAFFPIRCIKLRNEKWSRSGKVIGGREKLEMSEREGKIRGMLTA